MIFKIKFLCITLLLISLPSCWQQPATTIIVESNSITDLYQQIEPNEYNKNTLVVFDIDNTVATQHGYFGDAWFSKMLADELSKGKSVFDVLPTYFHAQINTWLVPGEPTALPLIENLQNNGITVIALTARDYHILYRTFEQLQRIGVDFSATSPHKPFQPYGTHEPALYEGGIIFAGGHDKGEVLLHWLDQMKYNPTKIIFIDDKLKNIRSVQLAAQENKYPFVGIRYGYFDDHVKNIDMQKAEVAYKELLEQFPESKPIKLSLAPATS